ncbi:PKD domain-containing protein [Patescibacteria group bacterium]|nr:MAG: PKD domain-containing protein [Patescibacteria group bacterium]
MRRKLFFFLSLLAAGSFFVFTAVRAANTDIVINEVGAYAASTHEWIEIWNKGNEPVDLSEWKFWEDNTNHGLKASDPIVSPGEYVVIAQVSTTFMLDYPSFAGSVFDSSWSSLNESGEEIGLKDVSGNFVEKFTYINAPNFSLQRIDPFLADYTSANWREHTNGNTVGAVNSVGAPATTTPPSSSLPPEAGKYQGEGTSPVTPPLTTPSQPSPYQGEGALILNEIYPNPPGSDIEEEFIEIKNTSTAAVDLVGWKLSDLVKSFSLSGSIGPGQIVIWKRTTTGIALNNSTKEEVKLSYGESVVDMIKYDKAPEGQSYSRVAGGKWQWSDEPTPGAENVITETDDTEIVWKINAVASAELGEMINFDAADSADPRGGVLSFAWNFGDGVFALGEEVSRAFATSGKFSVIVSATSTSGTAGSKKISIAIGPGLSIRNSAVVISEIFSDPLGLDTSEYIELYNSASSTANLSGWILRDVSGKKFILPDKTFINGGGFLVFYRLATKINLENTGDKVELLSPDSQVVDLVKFGKSEDSKSYALVGGEWKWQTPSPGRVAVASLSQIPLSNSPLIKGREAKAAKKTAKKKTASKNYKPLVAMTIEQARQAAKGTRVKIRGIVSAVAGNFGVQFFYISDPKVALGMQIYSYKKDFPDLKPGDYIEVRGERSEAGGVKRVKIKTKKDIDILATERQLKPAAVAPDEIDDEAGGALVKVAGEITEIKSNLMYLDDGAEETVIYFKKYAKIDKKKFKEGENVEVVGVLEQGKNGLQVWPRSDEDVVSFGPSPDLLKKQEQISAGQNKEKDTTEKYLTATAGGVTTLLLGFLAKARGAALKGGLKKIGALAVWIFRKKG